MFNLLHVSCPIFRPHIYRSASFTAVEILREVLWWPNVLPEVRNPVHLANSAF